MSSFEIGYAAMLEQFSPREAVALARTSQEHGFRGVTASDHFQPWTPAQGQAGFLWSVLTAMGMVTDGRLGTGVTTPTFRVHPAVVAQASATLACLFPGRHWLGIGSGEAINEHVVGAYWPEAPERINRMFEAVQVIKKLFTAGINGKDVRHSGTHFTLESTRIWSMPETAPEVLVATAGPVTAKRAGRVADGIVTSYLSREKAEVLLGKFAEGAKEAGKNPDAMPRVLQLHLSWAETRQEAVRNAVSQWPQAGMRFPRSDIRSPFEIEQFAGHIREEDFEGRLVISEDPDVHRAEIQRYLDLGFDRIYLHNVGRNQLQWLEVFGRDVLPKLAR